MSRWLQPAWRTAHAASYRSISSNPRIIESNIRRKLKKGVDRLPSQGADPAAAYKHGWRLASAAMLERYPIILREPHAFAAAYELGRFKYEQQVALPMPAKYFLSERDHANGRTEPDFHDPQAELYTPAGRVTDADRNNDMRSLKRALDERLYFLVRTSPNALHWRFPQTLAGDAEVTMQQHGEKAFRAVTEAISRPKVHFISYSPACHLEHVYPVAYQQQHDVYGVKIFFYRAVLLRGQIDEVRNAVDFAWARESELLDMLGEEYYGAVKAALLGFGPRTDYEV